MRFVGEQIRLTSLTINGTQGGMEFPSGSNPALGYFHFWLPGGKEKVLLVSPQSEIRRIAFLRPESSHFPKQVYSNGCLGYEILVYPTKGAPLKGYVGIGVLWGDLPDKRTWSIDLCGTDPNTQKRLQAIEFENLERR